MKTLTQLIDYVHSDVSEDTKKFILEQMLSPDSNKGLLWEAALAKKMEGHTKLLGGNTVGKDFTDGSDAKFGTFYRLKAGGKQASVSNIRNKTGPLRVCLCDPGQNYHRLFFFLIPYEAYQEYKKGSGCIKFGLNPRGSPNGNFAKYLVSFEEVAKPLSKVLDIKSSLNYNVTHSLNGHSDDYITIEICVD